MVEHATRNAEHLSQIVKLSRAGTWITLALLTPVAGGSETPERTVVRYISNTPETLDVILVAHQDDWQLFMGDVVARQIRGRSQVRFIYLTAGDVGRDSLYWRTRERAALQSTRVALGLAAADSALDECSNVTVLGHPIRKCTIANTDSYFLRLPDGRRGGTGFAVHSFQSLRKLRARPIASITAVDGSTSYENWAELISTVGSLIGGSENQIVTIHANDPSVVVNPHDHFDHRMAGLLAADLRRRNKWNAAYYAGYAVATRPVNRSQEQARQKKALFLAYDRVMAEGNSGWSAYREHPAFYSECLARTYSRSIILR